MNKHKIKWLSFLAPFVLLIGCSKNDTVTTPPVVPPPPTDTATTLKAAAKFPIGFAIENNLFSDNPTYKATVLREGNSVTFGNEMKYGSIVQNDGTFNFATADAFVNASSSAGLAIFGHTLAWHSQQNATYLNSYAGIYVPGATELISNGNFEDAMNGWTVINTNGATIIANNFAAEAHNEARSMKVINPTANPGSQWKVQVSSPAFVTVPGKQYIISYWVRAASAGGSLRLSTGPTAPQYQNDQSIGTSWQKVSWIITASLASTTFLFDMGQVANTYIIDEASVREVVAAPSTSEVNAKLETALNQWTTAIVARYKDKVRAWDVVNELFANDGAIRNNSNTTAGNDVFVWSHYMGRQFAYKAFQYAAAADPTALLFINDYNLELTNTAKLDSFVAFATELKSKGIKIDGVGTQMHMSVNTSNAAIDNMFRKMASTGLKVRISELDIRTNPNDNAGYSFTAAEAATQAAKFKYVVASYMQNVPPAQQHGITFWGVDDPTSWITAYQKKNDFPLLFDLNFAKKPAYTGVMEALKGK